MGMDINASGDLIAVSRTKQSAVETAATLDSLILFNEASQINVKETRETNQGDKTGYVEPTEVDVKDRTSEGTLAQDKASPDGIAWMFAFLCGNHAVTTPTGSVKRHTFKMNTYPANPAYFTAAHRKGGSSGSAADFRRIFGLGINTLEFNLAKNEFMKTSAGILGVGKFDDSIFTEIKVVNFDAASTATLTLDPIGATDADKAANITAWADMDTDGTYELPVPVVSYVATTNVLTLTDIGAGPAINVRITYQVANTETGYTWADLAALQVQSEFTLKAGNLQIKVGGKYSEPGGIPTFTGGEVATCELESMVYKADWQGKTGRCWRIGNTEDPTATAVEIGDMLQTVTVSRQVRNYLFKQNFDANTSIGLYFDAIGPTISGGEPFYVKMYIPKLKFLTKDYQISDKKWVEAGDLVVLKDTVNGFATSIVQVQNLVASYL